MVNKPNWKIVEEIAALLEKSLVPSARVEHNVFLPVLGKPNRKPRQCDVVITYGKPSRETITIVEVQKRKNRKPDINTFHGWVTKMREVGAQHLICVSALGFPKSIIDEVMTTYGPIVRLLTLEELDQPIVGGLNFVSPYLIRRKPLYSFVSVGPEHLAEIAEDTQRVETTVNAADKIFSFDDSPERQSLIDLVDPIMKAKSGLFLEQNWLEPNSYTMDIMLGSVTQDLWFHQEGERRKIKQLPVRINVKHQITEIPMAFYAYKQEIVDDVLAWVASSTGTLEGENFSVHLVFKPEQGGILRLAKAHIEGTGQVELLAFANEDDARESWSRTHTARLINSPTSDLKLE